MTPCGPAHCSVWALHSTLNFLCLCLPTSLHWFLAEVRGTMASIQAAHESLQDNGYAQIDAQEMKSILLSLCADPQDLEGFRGFWSHLGQDPVYPFRKTSQTRMLVSHSEIQRQPSAPFQIPAGENLLLGDRVRLFPEATAQFLKSSVLKAIFRFIRQLLLVRGLPEGTRYISGCHQFRVSSCSVETGALRAPDGAQENSPSPEGVHQDGAELVVIMFINSENMAVHGGESRIYDLAQPSGIIQDEMQASKNRLLKYTMSLPFETIVLEDRRVKHDNMAVIPVEACRVAHRDVLVIWVRKPNKYDTQVPFESHSDAMQFAEFPEDD